MYNNRRITDGEVDWGQLNLIFGLFGPLGFGSGQGDSMSWLLKDSQIGGLESTQITNRGHCYIVCLSVAISLSVLRFLFA